MLIANFIVKCENNNIHALSIRFIKVLTEPAIPLCTVERVKFSKRNLFDSGK